MKPHPPVIRIHCIVLESGACSGVEYNGRGREWESGRVGEGERGRNKELG